MSNYTNQPVELFLCSHIDMTLQVNTGVINKIYEGSLLVMQTILGEATNTEEAQSCVRNSSLSLI